MWSIQSTKVFCFFGSPILFFSFMCYYLLGWLEVIFHPLLFRTKCCANRIGKDGLCSGYGIYCAKAHGKEILRSLKKK